jgi:hypothetical protein
VIRSGANVTCACMIFASMRGIRSRAGSSVLVRSKLAPVLAEMKNAGLSARRMAAELTAVRCGRRSLHPLVPIHFLAQLRRNFLIQQREFLTKPRIHIWPRRLIASIVK